MSSLSRRSQIAFASAWLAVAVTAAQAEVVSYVGTQGPKANLASFIPPTLETSILTPQSNFESNRAVLGGNEFEGAAPVLNFSYGTGVSAGNATFTGGTIVPPNADPDLGRYNMTPGVINPNTGSPGIGHWVEAMADFDLVFSTAISAFSFFVTDLGDYSGVFAIELYDGTNRVFSQRLQNSPLRVGEGNGNLMYFGVTSSDPLVSFTKARFLITQVGGDTDVIGFDSFSVGTYTGRVGGTPVPEPTSLALVGLALCAAGWARKGQRAA